MNLKLYLKVSLLLLVILMAAFAIVWPLNGAAFEDWSYISIYGKMGFLEPDFTANRQFVVLGAILANLFMPDRPEGFYLTHFLAAFISSIALFHLARRLINRDGFAFVFAAGSLLYIPYNLQMVLPLYINVYLTALAYTAVASALYVESYFVQGKWRGRILAAVAGIIGLFAVRSYEATLPILFMLPLLIAIKLAPPIEQRPVRLSSMLFALARPIFKQPFHLFIWWFCLLSGLAATFILIRFASGYSYLTRQVFVETPWELARNTLNFYAQSFPIGTIRGMMRINYLLPALVLALVGLFGFRHLSHGEEDNREAFSVRQLVALIVLGLIYVGISASVYIIVNIVRYRAHFFAAPSEVLVVIASLYLLALLVHRYLNLAFKYALNAALALFFIAGGFWYFDAQRIIIKGDVEFAAISFDEQNQFLRDLTALLPEVQDHTLIVYHCDMARPIYEFRPVDTFAPWHLYNRSIQLTEPSGITFQDDDIIYDYPYAFRDPIPYGYDELVILGCNEYGLTILDTLPPSFGVIAPENAALYNPYARIVDSFISGTRARVLSRH